MIVFKSSSLERKFKAILPNKLKIKILFFLVNPIVGKIIKKIRIKFNFFGGIFNYSLVSDIEAAKIFWGVWESSEIRFSKRFAKTNTIIELGSSVGVTLGVLSKFCTKTNFFCVEASPLNFQKLKSLTKILPNKNNYTLINKAIAYNKKKVQFNFTSTTGSKINHIYFNKNSYVPTTTLSYIIKNYNIKYPYTLITDIEGAEAEIFFKDSSALKYCTCIIAELENSASFSINDQILKLSNLGYIINEMYGNVFVFSKDIKYIES